MLGAQRGVPPPRLGRRSSLVLVAPETVSVTLQGQERSGPHNEVEGDKRLLSFCIFIFSIPRATPHRMGALLVDESVGEGVRPSHVWFRRGRSSCRHDRVALGD